MPTHIDTAEDHGSTEGPLGAGDGGSAGGDPDPLTSPIEKTEINGNDMIPSDILRIVARLVGLPPAPEMVLVCKDWCLSLLGDRSLWKDIHLNFEPPWTNRDQPKLLAALRRAGAEAKIRLHLSFRSPGNINAMKLRQLRPFHEYSVLESGLKYVLERGHQSICELDLDIDDQFWLGWERVRWIDELFNSLCGNWATLTYLSLPLVRSEGHPSLPLALLEGHSRSIDNFIATVVGSASKLTTYEGVYSSAHNVRGVVHQNLQRLAVRARHWIPVGFVRWSSLEDLELHCSGSVTVSVSDSSANGGYAFPLLKRADLSNCTLHGIAPAGFQSITELKLTCVELCAPIRSVDVSALNILVLNAVTGIECLVAPALETLTVLSLNYNQHLSSLFDGHPMQLDPHKLDLRGIYAGDPVPLHELMHLRRTESITVGSLAEVTDSDEWKYTMLASKRDTQMGGRAGMVLLPEWRMLVVDAELPDRVWDIIFSRQIEGFPVEIVLVDRFG
jgi:hypothetical protein